MSEKINYNRNFRKIIKKIYDKCNYETEIIAFSFRSENEEEYKRNEVIQSGFLAVGYGDLYKQIKSKIVIGIEDKNYLKSVLTLLKSVKDHNYLPKVFMEDPSLETLTNNAMLTFNDLSVYDKIFQIKCLTEQDNEQIQKINTMHYQDLENYDIDITIDFIMKKMEDGLKYFSEERLLIDAAKFISDLLKIEDEDAKKIIRELVCNDIRVLHYLQNTDQIKEINDDEKLLGMHERYNEMRNKTIDEYIDGLRNYQIGDLLKSYSDYHMEEERIAIEEESMDNNLKNKLKVLRGNN